MKFTVVGAGDSEGKEVIDITNPLTPDYMSLAPGHETPVAAEQAT